MARYAQQKRRIKIPLGYTREQREAIGKLLVEAIRDRTIRENIDKNNQAFGSYSSEYAKEKGSSRVNLTETGDMLDNLKVLKTSSGYVTIGYEESYEGMGKVKGNRTGQYGNNKQVAPKRDFIGIPEADVADIVKSFTPDEQLAAFEDNIARTSQSVSRDTIERLRTQDFLRELGLDSDV